MNEPKYPINQELIEEMSRLLVQAGVLNTIPLPSALIPDGTQEKMVLDLACGPGSWAHMVAQGCPHWHVTGMDISQRMINFAEVTARAGQVDNVRFQMGDATKPLEFPDDSFDFIYARAIQGFMKLEYWSTFLVECKRILKSGGIIQLIEGERPVVNSPAMTRLHSLLCQAGHVAGINGSLDGQQFGIVHLLPKALQHAGFILGEHTAYPIDFSAGMPAHDTWCENMVESCTLLQSFLLRYGAISVEEVEHLLQEIPKEMAFEDFCAVSLCVSICAKKP